MPSNIMCTKHSDYVHNYIFKQKNFCENLIAEQALFPINLTQLSKKIRYNTEKIPKSSKVPNFQ